MTSSSMVGKAAQWRGLFEVRIKEISSLLRTWEAKMQLRGSLQRHEIATEQPDTQSVAFFMVRTRLSVFIL